MPGPRNLERAHIFLLFAGTLLFSGGVIAAEIRRNDLIRGAVNQPLSSLRDRKLHGIGFAVMVGDLARRSSKKLDHSVVAEMKLVGALQVNHSGERNSPGQARLMSREAKRKLPASRVTHHDDPFCVQVMGCGALHKKMIGGTDIGKRARPCPAFIAHAAVFEVGRGQTFCGESAAEVTGVIEVVFGAPEAPVDVDDEWIRRLAFSGGRRQTQIKELVQIRAIRNARISGWCWQRKNVVRHARLIVRQAGRRPSVSQVNIRYS